MTDNSVEKISGALTLNIIEAALTRDTEMFGKMDPYVSIKYLKQKVKTPIKDEAGKKPCWDFVIEFFIKDIEDIITLDVKDKDVTTSDAIGTLKCPVKDILDKQRQNMECTEWYEITYKGKSAG